MTQTAPGKHAVNFILITILIDVLALGVTIPVWPSLMKLFNGGDIAAATRTSLQIATAWAALQFFAAPVLGALSDRFGRRPVVLLSNLGSALDLLMMALAPTLAWLVVGRMLSAVTAASFSAAQAYIADVTLPEKRAEAFGMIGAAWSIGFVLGPVLGGVLGDIDVRLPFFVAAGMAFLNFLYGWFVLPESLPPEKRRAFDIKNANAFGAFKFLLGNPAVLALAGVYFLSAMGHQVYQTVFTFYGDYRYNWNGLAIGITLGIVGICGAIVQGFLIKHITGKIGERKALYFGLCIGALGMLLYGLAPNQWLFWSVIPVMAFWGISGPSLQALASKRVSATHQGELQGTFAGLMSISSMLGPLLFGGLFSWAVERDTAHTLAGYTLVGLPFFLSSALLLSGALLAWRVFGVHAGKVQPV
jgi:MFS transporter, DHA1 family, tetracycline resistance protein